MQGFGLPTFGDLRSVRSVFGSMGVVGLTASYNYSKQNTVKGVGTPFKVNKLAATLTAQF